MILFAGGVYLLIEDLSQEQQRQTTQLIRLSPRSGCNILLGKLLGVPILIYEIVVLLIPVTLITGIRAGVAPSALLSFFLILIAVWILVASAAILYCLCGGAQAWLASSLLFFLINGLMAIMFLSGSTPISDRWLVDLPWLQELK